MNHNHGSFLRSEPLEKELPECPEPGKAASPLGWSIKVRLLYAAAAATFLWLAVAWALGWLS